MFLDKVLSYNKKVVLAVICSGFWIYFRTSDCYTMIPRLHIFPVLFVMGWTYLNYYDPLFLPLGLSILIIYPKLGLTNEEMNKSGEYTRTSEFETNIGIGYITDKYTK